MAAFELTITGLGADAVAIPVSVGAASIAAGRGVGPSGGYPNASDDEGESLVGLSLHSSLAAGKVFVVISGTVFVSNTLTAGQTIILRETAGQWDYEDTLASGERYIRLGYAIGTGTIVLSPETTGYRKP